MKKIIKITTIMFAFFLFTGIATAQKYGYINSQALLAEMEDVKQARANLEVLQKQLQSKGQNMVTALQAKYQKVQEKAAKGELSPQQQEEEGKKLKAEEDKIGKFQQSMQDQLAKKESSLLQPILTKVDAAIKSVAKENGYNAIFDTGTSVLLYADESMDVTALVKAKLGI